MKSENISQLIERLAPQINATTFVEPRYKRYGVIFFQNGKRLFFKNKQININVSSTVSVTRNKFETCCFLAHFGYNVPIGKTFSKHVYDIKNNRGLEDGMFFAKEIGFPVILKPNDKSQGMLVCKVHNEKEFSKIAKKILKKKEDILLVEKFYGNYADYRIVVLGNKVISAYQRIPLTVIGNGKSTIMELLQGKRKYFETIGRPAREINIDDFRIKAHLKSKKLDFNSVPLENETVTLLDNSNLSSGGTTIELTESVADEYKKLAVSVARDLNLCLCGVDILTSDIAKYSDNYVILEINSAPGLDNYAYTGNKQIEYVDNLYLQVLRFVEKLS